MFLTKTMIPLSKTSRIILALASLSLIAVYFLPIWRIDLFAPQYPEGLVMKIWYNDISGDVETINGLNHYIGMRHINVDMFPEFKILPYVIAFYILLGLAVAIIGNRKILFWYLVFSFFGALFALYDFYRWGYEYGHNLDPAAPIKVPGLSYQPPVIGHKRLLNFDAYSLPEIGGWMVVAAASIAFLVWFFEWYKKRKMNLKTAPVFLLAIPLFTLLSCASEPEPIQYGADNCYFCKMGIADSRFGAEIVTRKGKVYKFDDTGCMVRFIKSGEVHEKEYAHTLVTNYEKPNELLDTKTTFFVQSPEIRSPMNFHTAAFVSREAAENFMRQMAGSLKTWNEILKEMN